MRTSTRPIVPLMLASLFAVGCWSSRSLDVPVDVGPSMDAPRFEDAARLEDATRPLPDTSDTNLPTCDDGDPCTEDSSIDGACVYSPSADGVTCDDGDRCTHADQCVAGICVGEAGQFGPPQLIAEARPRYRGLGRAVGRDQYVFVERMDDHSDLTFAHVSPSGFTILDELRVEDLVTSVESLGEDIAVLGTPERAYLITLEGDRLHLRGSFETGAPLHEVALVGEHLFACIRTDWISRRMIEFDARDLDDIAPIGDIPINCESVVASLHEPTAYFVNSRRSVSALDVQDHGVALVRDLGLDAQALHWGSGYLTLAETRSIRVVRAAGLEHIATLTPTDAGSTGGTFQSARVTSRGLEVLVIDPVRGEELVVYEIRAGSATPLVERARASGDPTRRRGGGVGRWASHNDGIRLGQHLYSVDDTPPFLRSIDDPDLSWPGTAIVRGDTIYLRNHDRSVRVDVSDPTNPHSVAGGAHGGVYAIALDVTPGGAPELLQAGLFAVSVRTLTGPRPPLASRGYPVWVAGRTFDGQEQAFDTAVNDLDLGVANRWERLHHNEHHVYRTITDSFGAPTAKLSRFGIADFADRPIAPEWERDIAAPTGEAIVTVSRFHDDHNTAFSTLNPDGDDGSSVYWQSLAAGSEAIGPFVSDYHIMDLAVHGERIIALGAHLEEGGAFGQIVLALEVRDGMLVEVSRREWTTERPRSLYSRQIVFFDGEWVYLQTSDILGDGPRVLGTRFEQLNGALATYPLAGNYLAHSFAPTDYGIVVTFPNYLAILEPWCE